MNSTLDQPELVDPDPFALGALLLAGVSTILQLVQTYKSFYPSEPPPRVGNLRRLQSQPLNSLDDQVGSAQQKLRRITRAVDLGSAVSEEHFYAAPMRIGRTQLLLDKQSAQEYTSSYAELSTSLGAIAVWIGNILLNHPDLAYRLGARMDTPLEETATQLNDIVANGRTVREVIVEARVVLEALGKAIEAELIEGRN